MDITWVSGTQDLRSIRDGITFLFAHQQQQGHHR